MQASLLCRHEPALATVRNIFAVLTWVELSILHLRNLFAL
jgi:hypothetical protein